MKIRDITKSLFGVDESVFAEAILNSPNARGYILGAISELILKAELEASGLQVRRIKEKWEGEKKHHGDFYASTDGKSWFIVESKGLKSNSEKWAKSSSKSIFDTFSKKKASSPEANWFESLDLGGLKKLRDESSSNPFRLCQTHMPSGKSTNGKLNRRTQASPRFDEFHLLAVDLFSKTGKHEFVYAISNELSRSKKDSNHLLQNYFITLVEPINFRPILPLAYPWTYDLKSVFKQLKDPVDVDEMQIDERAPGERAEGVLSF